MDDEAADLDRRIAEARAAVTLRRDERLLPLLVERLRLLHALEAEEAAAACLLPAPLPDGPDVTPVACSRPDRAERAARIPLRLRRGGLGRAARAVMAIVEVAPPAGIPAVDVGRILRGMGLGAETAGRSANRLERLGALSIDRDAGHWAMTDAYRSGIPAGSMLTLRPCGRNGLDIDPRARVGARAVIETLQGTGRPLSRDEIVGAVAEAGHSRETGLRALHCLMLTGDVVARAAGVRRSYEIGNDV